MTLTVAIERPASQEGGFAVAVRAAVWRSWMIVRSACRLLFFLVRAFYLVAAFAVLAAIAVGLLAATVGAAAADVLGGTLAEDPSAREGVAAIIGASFAALGVLVVAGHAVLANPARVAHTMRSTAGRVRVGTSAFAAEWSTAAVRLPRRRRSDSPRRATKGWLRLFHPGRTELPVRTRSEPLTGSRVWLVRPEDGTGNAVLIAPVAGTKWPDRILEATCDASLRGRPPGRGEAHGGTAPDVACLCGIYAFKGPGRPVPRHRAPLVTGRVALYGRVVEASRGYRAGRAEVVGPLRVTLHCAGSVERELWTQQQDGPWEPVPPGPCLFPAATLAVGRDEYVGLCSMHAAQAERRLSGVRLIPPLGLQAQLELRYGVEVRINERGRGWT